MFLETANPQQKFLLGHSWGQKRGWGEQRGKDVSNYKEERVASMWPGKNLSLLKTVSFVGKLFGAGVGDAREGGRGDGGFL